MSQALPSRVKHAFMLSTSLTRRRRAVFPAILLPTRSAQWCQR